MAYITELSGKKSRIIDTFGGVNRGVSPFDIGDGECVSMLGLDTKGYPQLKTAQREGPAVFSKEGSGVQENFFIKKITNDCLAVQIDADRYIYDTKNGGFKHGFDTKDDYNAKNKTYAGFTGVKPMGGKSDVIKFGDYYLSTRFESEQSGCFIQYGQTTYDSIQDELWGKGIYSYEEDKLYLKISDTETKVPANYFAVNQFRVYTASLSNSKMHYCAQNNPNNWTSEGDAGSFEVTTYDGENGSAIAAFGGAVIYFKNHSMHEFYGNTAANGRLVTLSGSIGCMSHHSIAEVGARLYWLGDNAVYCYDGGKIPTDISEPVKEYLKDVGEYTECYATTDGRRYILALSLKEGGNLLLSYDTYLGTWHILSRANIKAVAAIDSKIYGIIYDGEQAGISVYNLFEDEDAASWHWQSKYFTAEKRGEKQNFHSIRVVLEKPESTSVAIEITNNRGQKYEKSRTVSRIKGISDSSFIENIKIILPREITFGADWIQLKISGEGKCRIHSVETQYRERRGSW